MRPNRNYTVAKDRSQGILGFFALLLLCGALGYGAWMLLIRPPEPPRTAARRAAPADDPVGFVSVAAEGVDLELVAPGDLRTTTTGGVGAERRIPRSESNVDCPGFSAPDGSESACTASIHVGTPAAGDYTVIVRSTTPRAVVLNVGWASVSEARRGAFDVPIQVSVGRAAAFAIIIARDGVSQRSEPRVLTP